MRFILLIPILLFSGQVLAENYAFIFGGGESDKSIQETMFDVSWETGFSELSDRGFQVETVYNGGHSYPEQAYVELTSRPFTPRDAATQANVSNRLNRYLKKDFNDGDQMVLVIDTHGRPSADGEASHCVTMSDGSCYSLDQIKSFRDSLTAQGVRLAIVDLSCYSGTSHVLADDKTCVISASGSQETAYSGFPEALWGSCPGDQCNNLEDLFLAGFEASKDFSFPQISSPAGQQLARLTAQFRGTEPLEIGDRSGLSELLPVEADRFSQLVCREPSSLPKETVEMDQLQLRLQDSFNDLIIESLEQKIQRYNSLLAEVQSSAEADEAMVNSRSANFPVWYGDKAIRIGVAAVAYSSVEEIAFDYGFLLSPEEQISFEQSLNSGPAKKYRAIYNRQKELVELGDEINNLTRHLYLQNYDLLSQQLPGPNPCRDFKI